MSVIDEIKDQPRWMQTGAGRRVRRYLLRIPPFRCWIQAQIKPITDPLQRGRECYRLTCILAAAMSDALQAKGGAA